MNEKQSFIIEDLDDFHIVIKADEEWRVRRELEAEVGLILMPPPSLVRVLIYTSPYFPTAGEKHLHLRLTKSVAVRTDLVRFISVLTTL